MQAYWIAAIAVFAYLIGCGITLSIMKRFFRNSCGMHYDFDLSFGFSVLWPITAAIGFALLVSKVFDRVLNGIRFNSKEAN